ncbi:hypothetical protein DFJ73DRAFT_505179 [Zopfochytrium polystomum]|nr:hypothetical protein DFJ73DRAFT_505179 [Zopfochytrium polystomum]
MAPMISTAFHLLSPPQSLTSPPAILPPPMGDEFEVRNFAVDRIPRPSFAVATIHSFITELRRRPIPIRSALETMIQLRPYVPERISNFLLNCWYPLPWVPYSISNPWSLLEKAVESPTIGILIAVLKGAVVQDEAEAYNKWITESSEHRKEVRKHTAELESIHVATAISSIGRSNGPHVARAVENEGFVPGTSTRLDAIGNPPSTDSLLKQATSVGLDPQFDGHDILRNVLSHAATSAKHPSPLPVGENVTDKPRTKLKGPASKPLNPAFSRWNELGPYLERFEQLESLPLFFCHANKDTVLRPKDTLAGFSRSTSRWKAKIVYAGDETAERPEPPFSSGREDAFNSLDSRRKMRESLQLTPIQPPTETSSRTTSSTRPPQGPKVPPSLSDRYEVPGNVSYGHCDILMQNEIWERITEWLDVTSSRERDWRYKRRYSAK